MFRAHLDLVEGPFFIQTLDPHRGAGLVVRHIPALLTKTLRLEAGKRLVIRDGNTPSRHGLLPGYSPGDRVGETGRVYRPGKRITGEAGSESVDKKSGQ